MAYEMRVVEVEGIIELRFSGRSDFAEHAASRDQAFAECRKRSIRRVLVDLRDTVMDMSARELFDFGKSLDTARPLQNIRIAAIIKESDQTPDVVAAVAMTQKVDIRVFLTEEEARDWLLK